MRFLKSSHQYFNENIEYLSTSKWKEPFEKPFPAEMIANRTAKGDMAIKNNLLGKWDLKKEMMVDFGNSGHMAIEYWIKYKEMPDQPNLAKIVEAFEETHNDDKMYSELIAYDKERKIAGTIDILVALGDKEVKIRDLKFNGNIHKKGKGKLLTPFNDLVDSKINRYRLQLSMYSHLAKCMGLKVKALEILWFNGKAFDVIPIEPINLTEALKIKQ